MRSLEHDSEPERERHARVRDRNLSAARGAGSLAVDGEQLAEREGEVGARRLLELRRGLEVERFGRRAERGAADLPVRVGEGEGGRGRGRARGRRGDRR